MGERARAVVVRTAGTNCDAEMVRAMEMAGASVELVHVDRLIGEPGMLEAADVIGFPGGFSYGDDVAAGRVLAVKVRERLWDSLRRAAARGACVIGVCNGFQVLVQAGLLPGPEDGVWDGAAPVQAVGLGENASARFVDCWSRVEVPAETVCVWTRGLVGADGDAMMLPSAHGEGRVVASEGVLDGLEARGQVALRYASGDNPNGSARDIAGICDVSGRVFGLMPHPERYLEWTRHPWWTRLGEREKGGVTPGLSMFVSAVEAASSARV